EFRIVIQCPAPDAFQGLKIVDQPQVPSDAEAETTCCRLFRYALYKLDGDWVFVRNLQGQAERTFVAAGCIAHKAASTCLGVVEHDALSGISISGLQPTSSRRAAIRACVECDANNTNRAGKRMRLE